MNLQQMEYIVALDKYRHFVLAAEACGVTQPTLSAMIQKLEEELDVKVFNRDRKNITPTPIGKKIIRQAQIALNETQRIKELVADETDSMTGSLRIGVACASVYCPPSPPIWYRISSIISGKLIRASVSSLTNGPTRL